MILQKLSWDELELAAHHGCQRNIRAFQKGLRDKNVNGKVVWDHAIHAVCAEMAVCKWRNIYWTGLTEFGAADGGMVEIRWTERFDDGGLISYHKDADDKYLVLVDGKAPNMRIIGWTIGADSKRHLQPEDYYLTPRNELHQIYPKRKSAPGLVIVERALA